MKETAAEVNEYLKGTGFICEIQDHGYPDFLMIREEYGSATEYPFFLERNHYYDGESYFKDDNGKNVKTVVGLWYVQQSPEVEGRLYISKGFRCYKAALKEALWKCVLDAQKLSNEAKTSWLKVHHKEKDAIPMNW